MISTTRRSIRKQIVLGLIIGTAISVFPIELAFVGSIAALIFLVMRKYPLALATTFAVCIVAALLPLDHNSRKVGPFTYPPMAVGALAEKLRSDCDIFVIVDPRVSSNVVSLNITNRISRRDVLQKLADASDSKLRFRRRCLSGATLIFGAFEAPFLTKNYARAAALDPNTKIWDEHP